MKCSLKFQKSKESEIIFDLPSDEVEVCTVDVVLLILEDSPVNSLQSMEVGAEIG